MKVMVIMPTYNEKENITRIVPLMADVFKNNQINGKVLVVDDNSPDGTGRAAEELAKKYPVAVLHREKKEGLGAAYIAGFKKCLAEGADVICEMDADLSHDPEYFPSLIEGLKEADIVLGSRYISGGGTVNWALSRKFISSNANRLARFMVGLKINDITGGFRAYKAEVLRKIELDNIKSNGYAFQLEMLYRASKNGFSIKETPIIFKERKDGVSKLDRAEIWKFFRLCFTLGLERHLYGRWHKNKGE